MAQKGKLVDYIMHLTLFFLHREYGETWHKGGMLGNKQNVFDDFQAAAQYLIENKYSNNTRQVFQKQYITFTQVVRQT